MQFRYFGGLSLKGVSWKDNAVEIAAKKLTMKLLRLNMHIQEQ